MKFIIPGAIFLAQAFSFVAAQDAAASSDASALLASLAELPPCALDCITTTQSASSCTFGDLACTCQDQPYIAASTACVLANCTIKEGLVSARWNSMACGTPEPKNGHITSTVAWTLFGLSTVCITLRILSRTFFLEGNLGMDDWTIILVWFIAVPSTTMIQLLVNNGLGQNIYMLEPDQITNILFYFFVEEYLYLGIVMFTKISIVLLYMRIIPGTVSTRFNICCMILIAAMLGNLVGCIFGISFQSTPLSYTWTQWSGETKGTTLNLKAQQWAFSVLNVVFDVFVIALPIPRLIGLYVPSLRKKIFVIGTFLLGLLGTICTCIRLKYITSWGDLANFPLLYNNVAIWSAVEGDIGIFCACMPAIAGPFAHFFNKFASSLGSSFSKSRSKMSGSGSKFSSGRYGSSLDSKGATRVPSSTQSSDVENFNQKGGGISKAVETSMYNIPNDARSDDDVELVSKDYTRSADEAQMGRNPRITGHEYAGPWK